MTMLEAAKDGITKLRLPNWGPLTYVEIDITDGELGPIIHFCSDGNVTDFHYNGPYGFPCLREWVPYNAPILQSRNR